MNNLVFLDVETTGLKGSKIVQLAYKYDGKYINEIINPGVDIPYGAMSVHHITNDMVQDKKTIHESVAGMKLKALLENPETIIVAHNAEFDVSILKSEGFDVKKYICTMKVSQYLADENNIENIESFSLQYLRYYHGLKFEQEINPHDALSDIIVLEELFRKLVISIPEMVELSMKPRMLKTIGFGKYKGKKYQDVARMDIQYLRWLLGDMEKPNREEEQNRDVHFTLCMLIRGKYESL